MAQLEQASEDSRQQNLVHYAASHVHMHGRHKYVKVRTMIVGAISLPDYAMVPSACNEAIRSKRGMLR